MHNIVQLQPIRRSGSLNLTTIPLAAVDATRRVSDFVYGAFSASGVKKLACNLSFHVIKSAKLELLGRPLHLPKSARRPNSRQISLRSL